MRLETSRCVIPISALRRRSDDLIRPIAVITFFEDDFFVVSGSAVIMLQAPVAGG